VYSGGNTDSYCQASFSIPSNSNQANFIAQFSSFTKVGSACDFTNVGAVEIVTDLPPNVDIFIQVFSTYGVVGTTATATPSPSRAPTSNPSASRTPQAQCDCVCKQFHCVLEYDPSGVQTHYYDYNVLHGGSNGNGNYYYNHHGSSDASVLAVSVALIFAAIALL